MPIRHSSTGTSTDSESSNSSSSSSSSSVGSSSGVKPTVWAVFGLGNMGSHFVGTRHNIGMDVVTSYARHLGTPIDSETAEERAACTYVQNHTSFPGVALLLCRPCTWMNNSGRAVRGMCDEFGVLPKRCIVVYDDMDLDVGTIRIRNSGSDGGQNGVANVIKCMGDKGHKFVRVRVGIGRPTSHVSKPTNSLLSSLSAKLVSDESRYVLSPFSSSELLIVSSTHGRVHAAISSVITRGLQLSMTDYNKTHEQAEIWEQQQRDKQRNKQQQQQQQSHGEEEGEAQEQGQDHPRSRATESTEFSSFPSPLSSSNPSPSPSHTLLTPVRSKRSRASTSKWQSQSPSQSQSSTKKTKLEQAFEQSFR